MNEFTLFPTTIQTLDGSPEFLAGLDVLKGNIISIKDVEGLEDPAKTVRRGWRMNNPHLHKDLTFLKDYLDFLLRNIVTHFDFPVDIKYDMSSWLNLHYDGGFNIPHHHGDSMISGVLYLSVPDGSGNIVFRNPGRSILSKPDKEKFTSNPKLSKLYPPNSQVVVPSEGLCLFFPGWLEHYVEPYEPNDSKYPRISMSFNFSPGDMI